MTDRIAAIRALLKKKPDDVFLHYSLGMELASAGQFQRAVAAFRRCSEIDPEYLPAWVERGKCLRAAGRLDDARQTFTHAFQLAASAGETHTADSLKQQLQALPPE